MAKTNKQLQAEIDELIIERNNLIDRVDELEDKIAELTPQVEELQAKVDRLQEENKELTKVKVASTNNVDYWYKECQKLDKQHQTLLSIRDKQDKEIEELKEKNKKLQSNNVGNSEYIFDLEKGIDGIIEELGLKISFDGVYTIGDFEEIEIAISKLKDKKDDWRLKRYNEMVLKCKKLEEKYEQCFEELSTKLSEESDLDIIRAENEVIKQDKANLLAELTRQINEKQELRNKNKKLTKRRRTGRYNIDKFITNLTKGAYVYVEGASRPTKLHKRVTDAQAEAERLANKTNKKVYILTSL